MGVQEFVLNFKLKSTNTILLCNLEPGLDYTVSVSPERKKIPSVYLAFKTWQNMRLAMYNTSYENNVINLDLTTGKYKHMGLESTNRNIRQLFRRQTGTSQFTSFSPTRGVDSVPLNFRTKKVSISFISVCWESPIAKGVQVF